MKTISTPGSFWKVTKILKQEAKNSPQLESTLVNNDKNVRAVHYELPISRMDVILPADFDNGVVLESEEEGLAENTLFLLHLGRNSNDASLDCHDNLVYLLEDYNSPANNKDSRRSSKAANGVLRKQSSQGRCKCLCYIISRVSSQFLQAQNNHK